MPKERILIVDDERDMREFLEIMLSKEGYDAVAVESSRKGLELFREEPFDLVVTDLKMPEMTGMELLKALKEVDPGAIVIMITAYASVDTAIDAMKAGAYDYFTKPFKIDEIKHNIKNALKVRNLERENRYLKNELKTRYGFGNLIGTSPAMVDVYKLIRSIAPTTTNVFITGESGTGKELVARAIHYESDRREKSFVAINCGALPENLIESELFGHVKGAFTGASTNKAGLAEQADGGTLFLDEITELPLHLQVKLLRFIQERKVRRVGGTEDVPVDLRIVAASNRDLEKEVKEERFREDLYYRLNVIEIELPPLRDRPEDVPLLARSFVEKYSKALGKPINGVSEEAMELLSAYDYSGNVRELENIIERAVTLEDTDTLTPGSLPGYVRRARESSGNGAGGAAGARMEVPPGGMNLEQTVEEFEKAILEDALKKTGGVKKKAAELLGLSFRAMRYKLSKYDIPEN